MKPIKILPVLLLMSILFNGASFSNRAITTYGVAKTVEMVLMDSSKALLSNLKDRLAPVAYLENLVNKYKGKSSIEALAWF